MISTLHFTPYRLKFRIPWATHRGTLQARSGFIVKLVDENGLQGYGEAAPLPQFGTETVQQCRQQLEKLCSPHTSSSLDELMQQLHAERSRFPAAICGVESAIAALQARQVKCTLRHWINPNAADQVKTNQAVGNLNSVRVDPNGGTILKIKMGLAPIETEIKQLASWVDTLPSEYSLRLDCNQAWSNQQAENLLPQLARLPIESLEEPLQNPSLNRIGELQRLVPFPITLDESVNVIGVEAIEQSDLQRTVLKPTLLGGPLTTFHAAGKIKASGTEVVITTALEGPIGTLAVAQIAAAIDEEQRYTHGLSTIDCFEDAPPLAVTTKNGILRFHEETDNL